MNTELINKKVEYWENQLLDLGKRNKMISFRETKRATLRILEPSFEGLYDRLVVKEEKLTFQKAIDKDSDIRVYSVLSLMDSLSAPVEVRLGDIKAAGTVEESKKTLKDLRNKARLSLDEQGTNILYLVFGFVEWREKGSKDNWIKSPLILVPVSLVLESLNAPYVLKKYEDDLVVNPTLAYLFECDYGITLPEFDPDENSLEDFMSEMEQLVDVRGWRVLRETSLGLVSFLKISMYKDILNNEEEIKNNPIIQAFAGDTTALNTDRISEIDFDHDKEKASELYQVVDADSSQQDAILLSQKGVSFVMQGPPGTGKSQTITNIIAQGLADGKKILFVSEKMAALEVVHRRLEEVHLADFCLALHSHKANKKEILEQLGQNLNLKHIKVKDEEIAKLTRLDVLRDGLKCYVEDIHKTIMPIEMSLYEVYGAIAELQDLPFVRLTLDGIGDYSKDEVNRMGLLVENLEMTRGSLGEKWYKNPWQGITISRLGNVQKEELKEKMSTLQWILSRVPNTCVVEGENILAICSLDNIDAYYQAFSLLDRCSDAPSEWIGKDLTQEKRLLSELESTIDAIGNKKEEIVRSYQESIFDIDPISFLANYEGVCDVARELLGKDYTNSVLFQQYSELAEELQAFQTAVIELQAVYDKMNTAYCNQNTDSSLKYICGLVEVCGILIKMEKTSAHIKEIEAGILEGYNSNIFDIEAVEMLNRFEVDYASLIKKIIERYDETVFGINKEFYASFEAACINVRHQIGDDFSDDSIYEKYDDISSDLKKLYATYADLKVYFDKMNVAYMPSNSNDTIQKLQLFLDVCTVLSEKTRLQEEISKLENEILGECEQSIFEIDVDNMLNRFKVEYTGFFRIFKKQYREDIKQLRLGYKNVKKKITNEEAIALLQKLRERKALLEVKSNELGKAAKILNVAEFNDIDSVLSLQEVETVKELISSGEELLKMYSPISHTGIVATIESINGSISAVDEVIKEIKIIESWVIGTRPYSEIKSDLIELLNSRYMEDASKIQNRSVSADKRLSYEENVALLKKLTECLNLMDEMQALEHRGEELLGKQLTVTASVLTESEVDSTKTLINAVRDYSNKFTNVSKNGLVDMNDSIVDSQGIISAIKSEIAGIEAYLKGNKSYSEIKADMSKLQDYNLMKANYETLLKSAREKFAFASINADTNWASLKTLISNFEEFVALPEKTGVSIEWLKFISNKGKRNEVEEIKKYIAEIISKKSLFYAFIELFNADIKPGFTNFEKFANKLNKCVDQFETMDLWIDYRECKASCEQNGLTEFVEQSEDIVFPEGQLNRVFLKAFYYAWIGDRADDVKAIGGFNARIHSDNVEKFRELDTHQLPVAQMRIREKLIEGMPDKSMFNRTGDEMSVLIHELGKKRKIMPLRKLFKSIPNLLLKLKPCLMMSPLSVSYFLEADTYKFDMVIFDEASQIFPQDAIGAIFRGAQVIIAGDSKQLPPTNFFAASTNNDSDYDSDDDDYDEIISDSILEEATNTIPNRSLLWHYRSRYEDLISFSNREIYGNNLVTFPSSKVNEADSGVEYIYVQNGVYENRCNKEEAAYCVKLIEQHIKKHPERSLGIIAFSESQQSTIEDAVQEFRKKHREYDGFLSEEKEEAFFIKNLENVQGDERDTIIFSICYGKNSQGRMFMRFGPLGHQGGERRLNVAITRAKYNVKLVGSIQPEDIDLDKTKSEGVRMLRTYIEFASRTVRESSPVQKKNRLYETDIFSESVALFLESRGYKVKRNIGTSDYTVDMAIEHPEIEGAYIAGIECDGDSYQMARTVRDRDHLRVSVMERMGWKMYRVWSTEWIQNEQVAKQKLIDFITDALKNYSEFETIERKNEEIKVETEEISSNKNVQPINQNNPYNLDRYQEGHWWDVTTYRANDNESRIADRMHEVIRVEQPIHLELLYKRMAGCFGNEKVTAPIRNSVDYVLKRKMSGEIKIDRDSFITLSDFSRIKVRRSLAGSPDRNIEYIPLKEIEEAMKLVLSGAFGVEVPSLILETARIFGFEKTGAKIRQRMLEAIESLEKQGIVRVSDERVQLLEG